MTEKKITIRPETKDDYRAVENLTREAFWNVYRPGCMEHYVLHCYRDDPAFVPELDLVMELDGRLMGQVIYVRSEIDCDDGRTPRFRTWKRCPGGADTPTAPHTSEPGCAILAALADGTLDVARLESYRKLKTENAYAADSSRYSEAKRAKFKEISKINKSDRKR